MITNKIVESNCSNKYNNQSKQDLLIVSCLLWCRVCDSTASLNKEESCSSCCTQTVQSTHAILCLLQYCMLVLQQSMKGILHTQVGQMRGKTLVVLEWNIQCNPCSILQSIIYNSFIHSVGIGLQVHHLPCRDKMETLMKYGESQFRLHCCTHFMLCIQTT